MLFPVLVQRQASGAASFVDSFYIFLLFYKVLMLPYKIG